MVKRVAKAEGLSFPRASTDMQCLLQLVARCLPGLTEDALAEFVALRSKRPKDPLPLGVSRE
eukprot:8264218-Lingulodinium_polyedra.AAC.1